VVLEMAVCVSTRALEQQCSLLVGGGAERVLREHSPAGALQQVGVSAVGMAVGVARDALLQSTQQITGASPCCVVPQSYSAHAAESAKACSARTWMRTVCRWRLTACCQLPCHVCLQAAQRSTQRSSSQKLAISIPSLRVDGA
jgi:hypothetical protein